MNKPLFTVIGPAVLASVCFGVAAMAEAKKPDRLPNGAVQAHAETLRWSTGPRSLPAGTQVAVLEGDPRGSGIFTMRLRVPGGTKIPPHWHPRAERVTVLSGKVGVGFGRRFDEERLRYFAAGDFYLNPPEVAHFVHFARDSVVQITGEGPWEVHYLEGNNSR
jgi:quercetin dioxygenase-like cupin family protein